VNEHVSELRGGHRDQAHRAHETAHFSEFSYGTSDRGASIRIPWAVAKAKKGWLEDRRPNANMDPYVVSALVVETVCGAAAARVGGAAPQPHNAAIEEAGSSWPGLFDCLGYPPWRELEE